VSAQHSASTTGTVDASGGAAASVGRVAGTEDATPLQFSVAIEANAYLQLDDVVVTVRPVPGADPVMTAGIVTQVRSRHEGASYGSDTFLIADGVLPGRVQEIAEVSTTRVEPEVYVPPTPGQLVRRATGEERAKALYFDQMERKVPVGMGRDGLPVYVNFEFLDGTRGAHVSISGISGVATKTSFALFLLHSIFTSGVLGTRALNAKALVFSVKGEDLLFLDHPNTALDDEQAARYGRLGLSVGAFESVGVFAPPRRRDPTARPDVNARAEGVTSFFWTLADFCRQELLPFLFADAEDDRQQYTMVVFNVTARLADAEGLPDGSVVIDGSHFRTFRELVDFIASKVDSDDQFEAQHWAGRAIGGGTVNAFIRRLFGAVSHLEPLVRADIADPERHRVSFADQVTVVDLHNLNDRAKRFVVGVVLRKAFRDKEESGQSRPLQFVVLDELNKYSPREGTSPIKEILLDVAERGRSLGIILIGAQQTASEVERRIVANSAIRVVGRLDAAEAGRGEYGFLPTVQRARATILKPGTMLVSQPEIPIPLVTQFPFPAWATRAGEAGANPAAPAPSAAAGGGAAGDDPFAGLPR